VLRGRGGLGELALGHASLPGLLAGSSGLLVFLELLRITLVVNRDDVVAHLDCRGEEGRLDVDVDCSSGQPHAGLCAVGQGEHVWRDVVDCGVAREGVVDVLLGITDGKVGQLDTSTLGALGAGRTREVCFVGG